ncbi:MAG: hypothetical protein M1389_05765, partial [Chloroflexi bacterium]|nr:hypothetical protein [Chloroflexota bacterium]
FEHLGTAANAVFGQGSKAAEEWLRPLKRSLEEEGPVPILAALVHEQMTSSGIVGPRDVGSRPSGTVIRASVDNGHYRRPVLRLH